MNAVENITKLIEPPLTAMGYALVQIKLADSARRKTLSVMAERSDGVPMSFDDCTEISRTIGALMEVEDPITEAYDLEVCSPGWDRPLVKADDYKRFRGSEIKLETHIPIEGRKRFRGVVGGLKDNHVALSTPEGDVEINLANIRMAKLAPAPAAAPGKKKTKK